MLCEQSCSSKMTASNAPRLSFCQANHPTVSNSTDLLTSHSSTINLKVKRSYIISGAFTLGAHLRTK